MALVRLIHSQWVHRGLWTYPSIVQTIGTVGKIVIKPVNLRFVGASILTRECPHGVGRIDGAGSKQFDEPNTPFGIDEVYGHDLISMTWREELEIDSPVSL